MKKKPNNILNGLLMIGQSIDVILKKEKFRCYFGNQMLNNC